MILQALKEYYDRKAADPESGIAPEGWLSGSIDFMIEIDTSGKYVRVHCCPVKIRDKKDSLYFGLSNGTTFLPQNLPQKGNTSYGKFYHSSC